MDREMLERKYTYTQTAQPHAATHERWPMPLEKKRAAGRVVHPCLRFCLHNIFIWNLYWEKIARRNLKFVTIGCGETWITFVFWARARKFIQLACYLPVWCAATMHIRIQCIILKGYGSIYKLVTRLS